MTELAVTLLDWLIDRLYDLDAVIYRSADRLNRVAADLAKQNTAP